MLKEGKCTLRSLTDLEGFNNFEKSGLLSSVFFKDVIGEPNLDKSWDTIGVLSTVIGLLKWLCNIVPYLVILYGNGLYYLPIIALSRR